MLGPCTIITFVSQIYAPLAQLVEHLTLNQGVQGSSPWRRTGSPEIAIIRGFGAFLVSSVPFRKIYKKG